MGKTHPANSQEANGPKQTTALVAAAIALILALLVLTLTYKLMGVEDGIAIIAILLIPLLVYGVESGKITEITVPGGWAAKVVQTTSKTISASNLIASDASIALSSADTDTLGKQSRSAMEEELIEKLGKGIEPRALTMQLKTAYDPNDLASIMEKLHKLPKFKFAVIVDDDNQVVAYTPPQFLISETLISSAQDSNSETLSKLIDAIASDDKGQVKQIPVMRTDVVYANSTNAEALSSMESLNQDAIVVVDHERRYIGVIERQGILSHIIAELSKVRDGGKQSALP